LEDDEYPNGIGYDIHEDVIDFIIHEDIIIDEDEEVSGTKHLIYGQMHVVELEAQIICGCG
jgi:hypothetical protein